ncbi:hypothetical protein [Rhizobium sp. CNPSo 4039]|uniref:hypothetical protein n=1 Tax=Rhizobium sp. CNPSo 4039 TaxID=3021409 RepID=UPI00254DF4D8|nr:hypothetical protein [Rhizobium sp. CNPSo 4039]MDK4713626.1 hypothetical protein [Rhizobium sp. CNPSo 4039]
MTRENIGYGHAEPRRLDDEILAIVYRMTLGVRAARLVSTEHHAFRYALTEEGDKEAKLAKKWRMFAP